MATTQLERPRVVAKSGAEFKRKNGLDEKPFALKIRVPTPTNLSEKGLLKMNYSTIPLEIELPKEACLFDLQQLYEVLSLLSDKRQARGKQYQLALLLSLAILAKLADQNQIRGVAHWAKLRRQELATFFGLARARMPCHTTWSRVLGRAVEQHTLTRLMAQFLNEGVQGPAQIPSRGSMLLAIDGKLCVELSRSVKLVGYI